MDILLYLFAGVLFRDGVTSALGEVGWVLVEEVLGAKAE